MRVTGGGDFSAPYGQGPHVASGPGVQVLVQGLVVVVEGSDDRGGGVQASVHPRPAPAAAAMTHRVRRPATWEASRCARDAPQ